MLPELTKQGGLQLAGLKLNQERCDVQFMHVQPFALHRQSSERSMTCQISTAELPVSCNSAAVE